MGRDVVVIMEMGMERAIVKIAVDKSKKRMWNLMLITTIMIKLYIQIISILSYKIKLIWICKMVYFKGIKVKLIILKEQKITKNN